MAWASKTYTFSASTTAASAEVNQNFDDMVAGLDTAMPSGGIILWSGSSASIPSGWYLCDGNNGTPNLVNRFVVGATGSYAVGATGGEASHTLTAAEINITGPSTWYGTRWCNSWSASGPGIDVAIGHPAGALGGGGTAFTNLPPYYALCYIMKS